jgi:hypothetical protein
MAHATAFRNLVQKLSYLSRLNQRGVSKCQKITITHCNKTSFHLIHLGRMRQTDQAVNPVLTNAPQQHDERS